MNQNSFTHEWLSNLRMRAGTRTWFALASLCVASSLLSDGAAAASWSCSHGSESRHVWIEYPNGSALPCKVVYTKSTDGFVPTLLWSARTREGFCESKAEALIDKQTGWGWQCNPTIDVNAARSREPRAIAKSSSKANALPASTPQQTTTLSAVSPSSVDRDKPKAATALRSARQDVDLDKTPAMSAKITYDDFEKVNPGLQKHLTAFMKTVSAFLGSHANGQYPGDVRVQSMVRGDVNQDYRPDYAMIYVISNQGGDESSQHYLQVFLKDAPGEYALGTSALYRLRSSDGETVLVDRIQDGIIEIKSGTGEKAAIRQYKLEGTQFADITGQHANAE